MPQHEITSKGYPYPWHAIRWTPISSWWCHVMGNISAKLAVCNLWGNSIIIRLFPLQIFSNSELNVFFVVSMEWCCNKPLSCRWHETPCGSGDVTVLYSLHCVLGVGLLLFAKCTNEETSGIAENQIISQGYNDALAKRSKLAHCPKAKILAFKSAGYNTKHN